ncbi:MAG: YfhO family protein [Aureispira sp.]|nr:YfhO family protein [Aureispira sp.]
MAKKPSNKRKKQQKKDAAKTKASSKKVQKTEVSAKKESVKKMPKVAVDLFEQTLGDKSKYVALGALFFIAISIYGGFLLGNDVFLFKDIGSDTINVFYPNLYLISEYLGTEGIPAWSFRQGMGQNILPFSIVDPFNWFLCSFWGQENLAKGIAFIEFSKILLAGAAFYAYLRTMKLSYYPSIVGAMLYAFSGFMMIGSGWYIFTTEGLYMALLFLSFERLLIKKKWLSFPLAVMLIVITQPVNLFVMGLLLGVYSICRMLDVYEFDLKKTGITILSMAALVGIGVGMASISLLPQLDQMLNSPRVLGDASFFDTLGDKSMFSTVDAKQGITIIGRMFANDFLGTASKFTGWYNYLEAPMLYAGLATFLLIPQAFALMAKRQRIIYGVFLGIVLLPLIFPFLRYGVWLFAGDYYRLYSLIVIMGMLYMAIYGLHLIHKEKKVNYIALAGGFIFTMGLLYYPFGNAAAHQVVVDSTTQSYVMFFLVLYTALIASWNMEGFRAMTKPIFLILVAIELISFSKPTLTGRDVVTKAELTQKKYYNDYTKDAMAYVASVDQTPFYRTEKTYFSGGAIHSSINDAKVQGYYGTKSYHSFNQLNYIRFLDAVGIIDAKVESQTRWAPGLAARQLVNMMASNKYILAKGDPNMQVGHGYKAIQTVGDVHVFQNQNFIPFGFTYEQVLSRSSFDKLSNLKKDITLLNAAVIEDDQLSEFSAFNFYDTTTIAANYTLDMLAADAKSRGQVALNITDFSQNNIKGDIDLAKEGLLFFSMPFDQGWSATIDGQAAKLRLANVGFTALLVPAGKHTIELNYSVPYLQRGFYLSLISALILGAAYWWFNIKNKPKDATQEKKRPVERSEDDAEEGMFYDNKDENVEDPKE